MDKLNWVVLKRDGKLLRCVYVHWLRHPEWVAISGRRAAYHPCCLDGEIFPALWILTDVPVKFGQYANPRKLLGI